MLWWLPCLPTTGSADEMPSPRKWVRVVAAPVTIDKDAEKQNETSTVVQSVQLNLAIRVEAVMMARIFTGLKVTPSNPHLPLRKCPMC